MESLFWQLTNRTAETQFIFNLFHLLLAGLTLLVLLHQLKAGGREKLGAAGQLMLFGFSLLVLHFAILTLHFGTEFFLRKALVWRGFAGLSHGFMAGGLLLVVAALWKDPKNLDRWKAWRPRQTCLLLIAAVLVDVVFFPSGDLSGESVHSLPMFGLDFLALLAVASGMRKAIRAEGEGRRAALVALGSMGIAVLLHSSLIFLPRQGAILLWNVEEHALSVSLFAFAWAAGERSHNLLDRVFVRLNLTFLILASLIMLVTVGMEKYQYLRLAEERSMNLAEFLRGHTVFYRAHGENLEKIFRHTEVLKRVVVEFGTLPELRAVNISLDGQRASFRYTPDWEVKEEIAPLPRLDPSHAGMEVENSFTMIRLPIEGGTSSVNQVEFVGTMDFINNYIGKYIILIYSLFTIMVGLASGIIGMIVTDTDRRLQQQYGELQETHQRLAQSAKLASIGQLAGGMAHEINNPITSILSLASHLGRKDAAASLTPRQQNSLAVIAQQAQRVSKIVGNLLTFARESHLELSPVDVAELLDTAITLVEYRLSDNAIVLRREFSADLPMILGDAGRLTEVFVNIFNNAIDAMPGGGTLIVRASSNSTNGGGVLMEVKDTGCGIPSEHLARVFDPFFTTKEPGRGTGLGLSISHGIVKDHGGEIWAESELGAGATLVITLPGGSEWI